MKTDTRLSRGHEWRAFHAANIRQYLATWRAAASARPRSAAACEAAYGLLEHTAMLWRYTGDAEVRRGPLCWPLAQRRTLVTAACRHLQRSAYSARALQLCRIDALSDHDMDMAETLLLERDGMQSALDFARDLLADVLPQKRSARLLLADAISTLSEGDDALLQRPDIISVASRILEPLRALIKVKLDEKSYWWFFHARRLDARFEHQLGGLASLLQKSPPVVQPVEHPLTQSKTLRYIQGLFVHAAQHLQAVCETLPLPAAAKSEPVSRVLLWPATRENLLSQLCAHGATRIFRKKQSRHSLPTPYANVEVAPRQLTDRPDCAFAQWRLQAPRPPRKDCEVLVVDVRSGSVIGTAHYRAQNNYITLTEGRWADFKERRSHCEDMALILLAKS